MSDPSSAVPAPERIEEAAPASFWLKLGGGSLSVSIIVHALLLMIGLVWVFQITPQKPPQVAFMPKGGGGGQPGHKSDVALKKRASMTPANAPRVAAKDVVSNFTLPEPDPASTVSSVGALGSSSLSGGLGGSGSGGGRGDGRGTGFGSGMGPGMGGSGAGANPFGIMDPTGKGLVGVFYDFKRDKDGKPTDVKALDSETYKKIIEAFTKTRTWREPRGIAHYTSPTKLSTKTAFFPGVPDTDAGKAFKSAETGPGLWVAHYTATVSTKEGGTWRFVGWGDNCLVVGINGSVKLDASDRGYTGEKRNGIGSADLPGKPGAILFEGDWFTLRPGASFTLDILIGDEGGIFAAGVLLQKKGEDYTKDARGLPNLPILRTADLSKGEIDAFKGQLPEAATRGPAFEVKSGTVINDL